MLPNHYHFILEQLQEKGISKFMQKLGTGYTMYFNKKYGRSGVLFQGKFRSAHIRHEEKLCSLSSYVNFNPIIHKLDDAKYWPWSSCLDYLGERNGLLCRKEAVLKYFTSIREYINYSAGVVREVREIKETQRELLE